MSRVAFRPLVAAMVSAAALIPLLAAAASAVSADETPAPIRLCGSPGQPTPSTADRGPWDLRVESKSLSSPAAVSPFAPGGLAGLSLNESRSLWCSLELSVCPSCLVQAVWDRSAVPALSETELCPATTEPVAAVCADLILEDPSVVQVPHLVPQPYHSLPLLRRPRTTDSASADSFNSTGSKLIVHFKLRSDIMRIILEVDECLIEGIYWTKRDFCVFCLSG